MVDELEEKRQKRHRTREGMIHWIKGLRAETPTESRLVLAAVEGAAAGDLPGAIRRVLDACTDEDIIDMLALCAGAHLYGELSEHIRGVQFLESEEERIGRKAKETAGVSCPRHGCVLWQGHRHECATSLAVDAALTATRYPVRAI